MSDGPKYEERYCAYVDILAFRGLIAGLGDGSVGLDAIRKLLSQIHEHNPQFIGLGDNDFQAQSISDAVALSTRLTASGLSILFDTLCRLSLALLYEGYFTRGAVCRGRLYHDPKMVFGDALVKAYTLESEVARYPRIMLAKDVVTDALGSNLRTYFADHIKQAEDGPFFLHFLQDLQTQCALANEAQLTSRAAVVMRFKLARDMIQNRFDDSVDNPQHFAKVQWLANYWNTSFKDEPEGFSLVTGPGLFKMRFLDT
jgi:hypothetical protein